jgi:hypothetical protein
MPTLTHARKPDPPCAFSLCRTQQQQINGRLRRPDLGITPDPRQRSPSPEPIYSHDGKRLNTREIRTKKKLEEKRHELIEQYQALNPSYKVSANCSTYRTRCWRRAISLSTPQHTLNTKRSTLSVKPVLNSQDYTRTISTNSRGKASHAPPLLETLSLCSPLAPLTPSPPPTTTISGPPARRASPHERAQPPADYRKPEKKITDKVMIPQDEHPHIGFMGLLIGPRGNTLKKVQKETGCKVMIRGRGTEKEGKGRSSQIAQGVGEQMHAIIEAPTEA